MKAGDSVEFCKNCPMKGLFLGPVAIESLVIRQESAERGYLDMGFVDTDGFETIHISIPGRNIERRFNVDRPMPPSRVQQIGEASGQAVLKRVAICRAKSQGNICPAFSEDVVRRMAEDIAKRTNQADLPQ